MYSATPQHWTSKLYWKECSGGKHVLISCDSLGHLIKSCFFVLRGSLVACAVYIGWLTICTLCCPINFSTFVRIWGAIVALYISEFIQPLTAVTWSVNTSERVLLQTIHTYAIILASPRFRSLFFLFFLIFNHWFASCCKCSVFPLIKTSVDCRLWQWCSYLHSVADFVRSCEGTFFLTKERILWSFTSQVSPQVSLAFKSCWAARFIPSFDQCAK